LAGTHVHPLSVRPRIVWIAPPLLFLWPTCMDLSALAAMVVLTASVLRLMAPFFVAPGRWPRQGALPLAGPTGNHSAALLF